MTARKIAIDVRRVSHAIMALSDPPGELETLCGIRGRWLHLTMWWSPLVMVMKTGTVNCMTCLVKEARQ